MAEQTRTIIVVEDDKSIAEFIAWALDDLGFKVHTVSTVSEALKLSDAIHPDLVVADLVLPDGLGSELLRHVRARVAQKRLATVMISAHPRAVEHARSAGVDACLAKPFDLEEFFSTVDRLVGTNDSAAA